MTPPPPLLARPPPSTGKADLDTLIKAVTNVGKDLTCTICMSLFSHPVMVPCTHAFCKTCLAQILQNSSASKNPTCPQCRKPFARRTMREDAKLARLVGIYKSIHPPVDQLSQVGTFSQLARSYATQIIVADKAETDSLMCSEASFLSSASSCPEDLPPSVSQVSAVALSQFATPLHRGVVEATTLTAPLPTPSTVALPTPSTIALPTPGAAPTPPTSGIAQELAPRQLRYDSTATPQPSASSPRGSTPGKVSSTAGSSTPKMAGPPPMAAPRSAALLLLPRASRASPMDSLATASESHTTESSVTTAPGPASPPLAAARPPKKPKTRHSAPLLAPTVPPPPGVSSSAAPKDPFRVGAVVTVRRRMGPGQNQPGGVAIVTCKHEDNTVDVRYPVNCTREKRVSLEWVLPGAQIDADSVMGIPSRSVSPQRASRCSPALAQAHLGTSTVARPVVLISGRRPRGSTFEAVRALGGALCERSDVDDDDKVWTHCVCFDAAQGECSRSLSFLCAVSLGLHVVSGEWLEQSLKCQRWVEEASFAIQTDTASRQASLPRGGSSRARDRVTRSLQGNMPSLLLLESLHVFVLGRFSSDLSDADVRFLVANCGGRLCTSLATPPAQTPLYFVCKDEAAAKQAPDWRSAQALLQYEGVLLLPEGYLKDCIACYTLLDPGPYCIRPNKKTGNTQQHG